MTVDTEKYLDFVAGVTKIASSDFAELLRRLSELEVGADCDTTSAHCCTWSCC